MTARPPRVRAIAGALALAATAFRPLPAQAPAPDEVKSAYLYNFARFVEWPITPARAAFNVCVMGDLDFYRAAGRALNGRRVGERTIAVRYVAQPAASAACEILYITPERSGRPDSALRYAESRPILTVGESDDFLARGGIIRFVIDEGTLQFEVNLADATDVGLHISSQMLQFARSVRKEPS